MKYTIPDLTHRLSLEHDGSLNGTDDGFEQGQAQNARIIAFAREVGGTDRFVGVEVFYQRTDIDAASTDADFDAVLVDTADGVIVDTLPPYDEIDPDWRTKR
ncbi:hypothetical protein SCB71_14345 [Herbiconiux sp. KACC 21604]|uniref:hypothetical protein n=1 Tax=unclassified Herbiconiux TaxID=2618217 RepID=UPI0014914A2B|nr:hypothetical protein [Herbiconiux sp. SALV-R1]QJU54322.1 hypothetical protein HL652_12285 [Herbiconiux sp. SALV-R1]WPO85392.1 hypothetical protein SCB71_14345 [Herbiconiux sp. KACC 21604]